MSYKEQANGTLIKLVTQSLEEKITNYAYELSEEDKQKLVEEITDSEDFYQRLDDIIEDAMHDWIDFLGIEKKPFTEEQEKAKDEFFKNGEFIVAPEYQRNPEEYNCYLWEDFEAAQKFADENPDIHIYTLIEAEEEGWISPGARWVNRFAYLLSAKDTGLKENEQVRFW